MSATFDLQSAMPVELQLVFPATSLGQVIDWKTLHRLKRMRLFKGFGSVDLHTDGEQRANMLHAPMAVKSCGSDL